MSQAIAQKSLTNSQWVQVPIKVEYRAAPNYPDRVLTTLRVRPKLPLSPQKITTIQQAATRNGISHDEVIFNIVSNLVKQDAATTEAIGKKFPNQPIITRIISSDGPLRYGPSN